jgi:rubrerythrin
MREDGPDVLGILIRHELAIKELYAVFATVFKNHKGFWQNLAVDEQRHADWLTELRSHSSAGEWLLHHSQLRPQAIKTSIGYVERKITRAKEGHFDLLEALSVARDLETALLERQLSKLKDSTPEGISSVLKRLVEGTERHLKMVMEALAAEKRKSS